MKTLNITPDTIIEVHFSARLRTSVRIQYAVSDYILSEQRVSLHEFLELYSLQQEGRQRSSAEGLYDSYVEIRNGDLNTPFTNDDVIRTYSLLTQLNSLEEMGATGCYWEDDGAGTLVRTHNKKRCIEGEDFSTDGMFLSATGLTEYFTNPKGVLEFMRGWIV